METTKIKVVGIGGSGGNAISRMMKSKIKGIELVVLNTDIQDLKKAKADLKLQIGKKITQGFGTGMNPEIGKRAAEEQSREIEEVLKGADLIFITGGFGGGTCSGASPVVAEIAKNLGALTIAIVTNPFSFEGIFRKRIAEQGLKKLKEKVDALLSIENDKLLKILNQEITISKAFWFCDEILRQAVQGITNLIIQPGLINVDFADVKAIMKNAGTCFFGFGEARNEKRAELAIKAALSSPLLSLSPKGAKGILFNVSSNDISLNEIKQIGQIITQEINPEAKIIFGAVPDEKLKKGEIKITLIATGF